jgi:hypothetical protein
MKLSIKQNIYWIRRLKFNSIVKFLCYCETAYEKTLFNVYATLAGHYYDLCAKSLMMAP